MSKLTLDLNGLSVESFAANGTVAAAHEPTTGTMTYAFCQQHAPSVHVVGARAFCWQKA
ncbi:MAG TPA: hypothetical protein VHG93_24560 [Longimicrobium sp.]|nr:hypothetical protein [Longimicrobium sp.]